MKNKQKKKQKKKHQSLNTNHTPENMSDFFRSQRKKPRGPVVMGTHMAQDI